MNFKCICRNLVRLNAISQFSIKNVIPLLNRKGYKKAIVELELALGIPSTLSLFELN